MEQEFQRADLEALMGGDALLDGQELSCGFVRIAAVGLLMAYRAKRGEEPLFDMNFNSGRPVLPFPFTLEQFKAFCEWHRLFRWEVIEAEFTNDDDTIDGAALAELDGRNSVAGMLVRSVLGMCPAPVVTASASDGAEPDKDRPLPLTTRDIAFCFDGLKWNERQWKKPLGDKPKWLKACVAIPGLRGVCETQWNPVFIGAALVCKGYVKQRNVRARFQTKPQLAPWLETWKIYESDNFDTE